MAEQMDAVRDKGELSNNNDAPKMQQPKAQENAQPKGGGLRNAISKNKKVGENVATQQAGAEPEARTMATRGGDKKKEAQTLTKEKANKKEAKGKENKKKEEEEEEGKEENTEEVEALEGEEAFAPNKVSWQDLKTMLNDANAMGEGDLKTQINATFFNTICPSSVAEKGNIAKLLKDVQAQNLLYNSNKSFDAKQAALQDMLKNANNISTIINTVLAGEGITDDNKKKALQQYLQSLQGFMQTIQSKLQYNQEVWAFYANNELSLDAALFQDKDFHAAFSNFANLQKEDNLITAYMQAKKGTAPKKMLFKTLYKGVKSNDKAVNEMLYKPKLRTGKKLQVHLPETMVAGLWSSYKTKKFARFKSTLKKEATPILLEQIQGLYNKFMASNITGDKI